MGEVRSYRDLKVWQLGIELTEAIYGLTMRFPESERFGLTSQLRRAAVSIPSNVAEGHARSATRDFLRFLAIARGSLAELETQLVIAERLTYVSRPALDTLLGKTEEISRMLRGLQNALDAKLSAPAVPALAPRP